MMKKIKKKKIVYALVSLIYFFSLLFPYAGFAYNVPFSTNLFSGSASIDLPSLISQSSQEIENRYGFNQDVWRSAKRKESAPRVEIFFDNTNPKPGEKVTAHAVPEFFKNDPQNLYYTWYIIHTDGGDIKKNKNSISEGKVEAAKLIAHGDYDPNLDGQTYANPNDNRDNDGWPPIDSSYSDDRVAAPMGGADGVGGLPEGNDNIEPYKDANAYCDTRGKHAISACNLYTAKNAFNQYYNLTPNQNGDYCNACQSSLLNNYNSTISPTGTPSSSVNSPNNLCCHDVLFPDPNDPNFVAYDPNVSYCPTSYNTAYESCFDYPDLQTYNSTLITSCLDTSYQACLDYWNNLHSLNLTTLNPINDEPVSQVSRCYKHNFGTNNPDLGFRGYSGTLNNFNQDDSGTDIITDCVHKWKDAKTPDCTADDCTSGSGKFPTGEERYWKTDPTDPDTDGDGSPDEADMIGLDQQSFTWNYQSGDRVGVVVEGTSLIPVDEKSAYYKIMWGYPDVCDSTKSGLMDSDECEGSGDFGFGFLATESPNEQGDDKLKISLTFSPDNPLADPSDENNEDKDRVLDDGTISDADQISILSSLENTTLNPNDLYYTWQIQKGDPQSDDWGQPLDISNNFNTTSPAAGMGISQFSFTPKKSALDADAGINYFKVTLTTGKASDPVPGQPTGRGRSSVIIPVNTKGISIILHKVDIQNEKAIAGDPICTDGLYKSLCPAVKGQMLAAEVSGSHYKAADSQFSWTVDGSPAYPPENASQLFDGWSNTTIFFPITKEEQEIQNISVTATSKTELQPATGTRLATVVHPAVFIQSGDKSLTWPKVYTAPDPNQKDTFQNIESSDAFEAITSSAVPYNLDFVPYYLLGEDSNSQISWSVNGTDVTSPDFYANNPDQGIITLENNDRTIKIPINDFPGTFLTLSAAVKKYWSDEERGIAYTAWGVAPNTLSGESSVSIEAVNAPIGLDYTVGAASSPGQILAAIGTHLPHYFMYLLRLVLTMAVMFIASAGFYGLIQSLNFSDEEK